MMKDGRRPQKAAVLLSALGIAAAAMSFCGISPALAAEKSAFDAARELANQLEAAARQTTGAPAASNSTSALPKGDPCSLLSNADVRKVYPKAAAAERERTREKYGIVACLWDHPAGRLGVQVTMGAKPGSAADEARGIAFGFTDPFKPAARNAIRFETLTGVGDEAVAVVEKADEKRGILSDVAYLYTQRGDRQLMIMAVDLGRGDRATALKTLQELGQAAASRL